MRLPFLELVKQRVVVLDGAMGSNLQCRTLDMQRDWLGQENISEVLNFSRPDVIQEIHEAFLEVGCDAVETNTFMAANKIVLAEAEMAERVFENNKVAGGNRPAGMRQIRDAGSAAIRRRLDRAGHEDSSRRDDRLGTSW